MSTADRLRQQHIPPRRPRARKASSTTDDIPLLAVPSPIHILPRLARHATDPACASLCTPPRSIVSTSARSAAYVTMTESVTITFSQTGVQPPVYVVTSLSEPPWEPLEMAVDHEQTASAIQERCRGRPPVQDTRGRWPLGRRRLQGLWYVRLRGLPINDPTNTSQPPMNMATATTSFTSSPSQTTRRT
jgi:hypothetical protein